MAAVSYTTASVNVRVGEVCRGSQTGGSGDERRRGHGLCVRRSSSASARIDSTGRRAARSRNTRFPTPGRTRRAASGCRSRSLRPGARFGRPRWWPRPNAAGDRPARPEGACLDDRNQAGDGRHEGCRGRGCGGGGGRYVAESGHEDQSGDGGQHGETAAAKAHGIQIQSACLVRLLGPRWTLMQTGPGRDRFEPAEGPCSCRVLSYQPYETCQLPMRIPARPHARTRFPDPSDPMHARMADVQSRRKARGLAVSVQVARRPGLSRICREDTEGAGY